MSAELQAGRELDARVARLVMGLEVYEGCQGPAYNIPGLNGCKVATLVPAYSTNIAAAFLVLERLRPDWEVVVQNHELHTAEPMDGWAVRIGCHEATAPTAPLAICLAALKALEGGTQ